MKTKFDFFGKAALVLTFAVAAATACRKDEVPVYPGTDITPSDYEIVDTPAEPGANPVGLYVLNEGNYGSNKAQLDFFNFRTSSYIRDIYTDYNPDVVKGLGDAGNDVQVYDGKLFVVVNNSHKVEILGANSVKRIAKMDIPNCRSIAFDGDCAYVTSYVALKPLETPDQKGAVYRIDLNTYKITGEVSVGYQPEQLVIKGGKAYVANSGGFRAGYDNTVSVVDLASMSVDYTIEVVPNLQKMLEDENGNLWVSSFSGKLSCLKAKDGKYALASSIDFPVSSMAYYKGELYLVGTAYDANYKATYSYAKVNVNTGAVSSDKIITDGSDASVKAPYAISVNPSNGDIYIADSPDFTASGKLFCYTNAGKLKWSVRTGNIPGHFAFLYK